MDNSTTECSTLVGVEMVTSKFTASYATDGMDEVAAEQIFKPVLIRVVGVRTTIEVVRGRVFATFFVTCILQTNQYTCDEGLAGTYTVALLVEHKWSNGPPSVGTIAGLATNTNRGTASAVLVLGSGDGTSGHRHDEVSRNESGEGR